MACMYLSQKYNLHGFIVRERLNFYPGFGIGGFERAIDSTLLQPIFQT